MSSRYYRFPDWVGSLVFVAFVILFLLGWIGAWTWVIVGGYISSFAFYEAYRWHREKRIERERLSLPCKHGVTGAHFNKNCCEQCLADSAAEVAEMERTKKKAELLVQAQRKRELEAWMVRARTPAYLTAVDPREFELIVCALFRQMGNEVESTPYSGDNGIDGFIRRNGKLSLLQCKRVKSQVGEPVLRDLYGTMHSCGAAEGIVVTTGAVSKQARRWADGKPIRIIELEELTTLIRQHLNEESVIPASFELPASMFREVCPRCGLPLRQVKGRYGRFTGCSGYPQCDFSSNRKR